MKKTVCLLGTIVGWLLIVISSALSAEQSPAGKNLCILYKQNCPEHPANYQETIQEMLRNLKFEIDKGKSVYTDEELEILNNKLRFEEEVWDLITG